jgi:hypothetical protein
MKPLPPSGGVGAFGSPSMKPIKRKKKDELRNYEAQRQHVLISPS